MADSQLEEIEFGEPRTGAEGLSADRCYFYQGGWYTATFAYLAKDGRWWGKGCTAIGDSADWEYWDGTRFKAEVCIWGQRKFICDVAMGPGDLITLGGPFFAPTWEITKHDDLAAKLSVPAGAEGG